MTDQLSLAVITGEGLPALSRKWAEQIQAGEYVDLAELPPAKGKARGMPKVLEGQILVVEAADLMESQKVIPDLATWVQCFSIFMAVVIAKEPARAKNLLAYLATIAKCSQKFQWPSWIVYDQNFRQMLLRPGARIGQKWTQAFTPSALLELLSARKDGADSATSSTMQQKHALQSLHQLVASFGHCSLHHHSQQPRHPSCHRGRGHCLIAARNHAESSTSTMGTANLAKAVFTNIGVITVANTRTLAPSAVDPREAGHSSTQWR